MKLRDTSTGKAVAAKITTGHPDGKQGLHVLLIDGKACGPADTSALQILQANPWELANCERAGYSLAMAEDREPDPEKTLYRRPDQLLDDDDFHNAGICLHGETNLRQRAVLEVLCWLPQKDYETLGRVIDTFDWLVPHEESLGQVHPFYARVPDPHFEEDTGMTSAPCIKVLYLSPELERVDCAVALGVVAHEFAHLVLNHRMSPRTPAQYDQQEGEAWERTYAWGFANEIRAIEQWHKDVESLLESLKRELVAQRSCADPTSGHE